MKALFSSIAKQPRVLLGNRKSIVEVDFVLQQGQEVIPIEVKAEGNLKAKSLKVYVAKFHSKQVIRLSMADYREQDRLENVPLYGVSGEISDRMPSEN